MRLILMLWVIIMLSAVIHGNGIAVDQYRLTAFRTGGSENDWSGKKIISDKSGFLYWIGSSTSTDFPMPNTAAKNKIKGKSDAIVMKLSPDLKQVVAANRVGGSGNEQGFSIDLDAQGNVYILGTTDSLDFPVFGRTFSRKLNGTEADLFIMKLSSDLNTVLASTYLGGSGKEGTGFYMELSIHGQQVIVAGSTQSLNFPVTRQAFMRTAPNMKNGKGSDMFVAILDTDLTELKYGSYFGGSGDDHLKSVKRDRKGNLYIAGHTMSEDLPIGRNAFKSEFERGGYNIFISKFSPDLSLLLASTYMGADSNDFAYSMTVSRQDHVYVTGHVGHRFTTSPDAYDSDRSGVPDEAYVVKLDSHLSRLLASTFLGGGGSINPGGKYGSAIITDKDENVYVLGKTDIIDYPVTANAIDEVHNGGRDIFMTKLDPNLTSLHYSTFIGGSGTDIQSAIWIDQKNRIYISGFTNSDDFLPMSNNNESGKVKGTYDMFICRLDPVSEKIAKDPFRMAKLNRLDALKTVIKATPGLLKKTDRYGRSLLHWAVRYGNREICRYLLKSRDLIDRADNQGLTALHLAVMFKENEIASDLIDAGATVLIKDKAGNLPIHTASFHGNAAILGRLDKELNQIELKNRGEYTPLHLAVLASRERVTDRLLQMGATFDRISISPKSLVWSAVRACNNIKVMDRLLKAGLKLEATDPEGRTLLLLAIDAWWRKTAHFLLERGSNIHAKDKWGQTALFYAIDKGFVRLTKRLLNKGARIDLKDKKGVSPVDLAKKKGNDRILELLVQTQRKKREK